MLPGELGAAKVTVSSGLLVDGSEQVEFFDDDTRTQVPVVSDDLNKLSLRLVRGTVGLDEDGQWAGNTNGIGQLDSASAGNLGSNERQGNVSGNVGTGTIDLGEILYDWIVLLVTTSGTKKNQREGKVPHFANVGACDHNSKSEYGKTLLHYISVQPKALAFAPCKRKKGYIPFQRKHHLRGKSDH